MKLTIKAASLPNVHQLRAVAIVTVINIFIPMCLLPFKRDVYQYSALGFWVFIELFTLAMPALTIWLLWRKFNVAPNMYSFRLPPRISWDTLGLSIMCTALLLMAYWPSFQIAARLFPHGLLFESFTYANLLRQETMRIPILGLLSIQAGVFESVVFIAWPWLLFSRFLRTHLHNVAYIFLSALAFSVSHYGSGGVEVVATFFLGGAATAFFLKIRDLWPIVFGHTFFNLLVTM